VLAISVTFSELGLALDGKTVLLVPLMTVELLAVVVAISEEGDLGGGLANIRARRSSVTSSCVTELRVNSGALVDSVLVVDVMLGGNVDVDGLALSACCCLTGVGVWIDF
jgi:hypothetical protein